MRLLGAPLSEFGDIRNRFPASAGRAYFEARIVFMPRPHARSRAPSTLPCTCLVRPGLRLQKMFAPQSQCLRLLLRASIGAPSLFGSTLAQLKFPALALRGSYSTITFGGLCSQGFTMCLRAHSAVRGFLRWTSPRSSLLTR